MKKINTTRGGQLSEQVPRLILSILGSSILGTATQMAKESGTVGIPVTSLWNGILPELETVTAIQAPNGAEVL